MITVFHFSLSVHISDKYFFWGGDILLYSIKCHTASAVWDAWFKEEAIKIYIL